MTMFAVFQAATIFLSVVRVAIFAYWILTLLRFNNRFMQLLAKFVYPFVVPFRRPAMWVMRRTGLPFDFTLLFSVIGITAVNRLLWFAYGLMGIL
ncbi:MAG: hypothetical protein GX592_12785 [Clostridiales bacterium]|nr:hypothetical protein [Clostridiales bacterium]